MLIRVMAESSDPTGLHGCLSSRQRKDVTRCVEWIKSQAENEMRHAYEQIEDRVKTANLRESSAFLRIQLEVRRRRTAPPKAHASQQCSLMQTAIAGRSAKSGHRRRVLRAFVVARGGTLGKRDIR